MTFVMLCLRDFSFDIIIFSILQVFIEKRHCLETGGSLTQLFLTGVHVALGGAKNQNRGGKHQTFQGHAPWKFKGHFIEYLS